MVKHKGLNLRRGQTVHENSQQTGGF